MHGTLQRETAAAPAADPAEQQAWFDAVRPDDDEGSDLGTASHLPGPERR